MLARLRLPGRLLFLFRIRFGQYVVLVRLGAEIDWGRSRAWPNVITRTGERHPPPAPGGLMRIYVAHPYSDDVAANVERVRIICRAIVM